MLDPTKANIKPIISELENIYNNANKLEMQGEGGALLNKSNGVYTNDKKTLTRARSFNIKVGGTVYGAIHTHPYTGIPMFSYCDIFGLLALYEEADPLVKSEVTLMLVCKDSDGKKQIYAIFKSIKTFLCEDLI